MVDTNETLTAVERLKKDLEDLSRERNKLQL